MLKIISDLFQSSQDIYNLLGIAGFILSAILWLAIAFKSRRNIKLEIKDYNRLFGRVVQLFIFVQNASSSPICITAFELKGKTASCTCELIPKPIRGKNESLIKTPFFPINLNGHQGYSCFLEFLDFQDTELVPGKTIVLSVHTNRGVVTRSLILSCKSHYLHSSR